MYSTCCPRLRVSSTDVRINSGGESGRKRERQKQKGRQGGAAEYKDSCQRYVLFKGSKKQKRERVRAHTLPLDCLISSSQAVAMCLHCTSAFTLSAASIIGLWFYFDCASVKSRTEEKYEHCASPSPLHLHARSPAELFMKVQKGFALWATQTSQLTWHSSSCCAEGPFKVWWSCLKFLCS